MNAVASQITSVSIVCSAVEIKENIKLSASLVFVWGIDRSIPHTKGLQRGKCFHLMTSSCYWKCLLRNAGIWHDYMLQSHFIEKLFQNIIFKIYIYLCISRHLISFTFSNESTFKTFFHDKSDIISSKFDREYFGGPICNPHNRHSSQRSIMDFSKYERYSVTFNVTTWF